jgi:hypothetical protein
LYHRKPFPMDNSHKSESSPPNWTCQSRDLIYFSSFSTNRATLKKLANLLLLEANGMSQLTFTARKTYALSRPTCLEASSFLEHPHFLPLEWST